MKELKRINKWIIKEKSLDEVPANIADDRRYAVFAPDGTFQEDNLTLAEAEEFCEDNLDFVALDVIKSQMEDDSVSFDDFFTMLNQGEHGNWDNVNSSEIVYDYINEMMRDGIYVSHMLVSMEESPSEEELWEIWLGNSMNTPIPINTKEDLVRALGIEI